MMAANGLPVPRPPAAPGDVVDPALVRLLPGVREGCEALKRAGFLLVVVSNQGVVARGGATLEQVEKVNDRLRELLAGADDQTLIDAVYICPFHPRGNIPEYTREHPWRKPGPGMVLAAAEELGIDLKRSWLIGDAERDIECGVAAGLTRERCLLVTEGGFAMAANTVLGR